MRSEVPSPFPEKEPLYKKLGKSKIARAMVTAAALHAPLVPKIGEKFFDEDRKERIMDGWSEGMVIRPQGADEQEWVNEKVAEREARINPSKVQQIKSAYREKLEHGERVTFRDLYFDMEAMNGIEPEVIAEAKRKADSLILKYSQEANGELSDPLIRRMVTELYGPEKTYDWGTGSASEYFVKKSRNCNAIAKGELIVFEGVVLRLPEDVQRRYELGQRKVERHVIATLKTGEQMYLLEPPIKVERTDAPESGTADIGLDLLKRAITAEKPIRVQARGGEDIFSGPWLDVVTDQPVDDGIVVDGKLRASDYVRRIVQERGIPAEENVTEVEILPLDPPAEAVKEFLKQREDREEISNHMFTVSKKAFAFSEMPPPSREIVKALNTRLAEPESRIRFSTGVKLKDLTGWEPGAIREVIDGPMERLAIYPELKAGADIQKVGSAYKKSVMRLLEAIETKALEGKTSGIKRLAIGAGYEQFGFSDFIHFDSEMLRKIFQVAKGAGIDEVEFVWQEISADEIDEMLRADVKRIHLTRLTKIPGKSPGSRVEFMSHPEDVSKLFDRLSRSKAEIVVGYTMYFTQIHYGYDFAKYKNIVPSFEIMSEEDLLKIREGYSDPKFGESGRRAVDLISKELEKTKALEQGI